MSLKELTNFIHIDKKKKVKMNIIMFIIGAIIFAVFLLSDVTEVKTKEKVSEKNYGYYARHQPEKDEINHS